MNRQYDPTDDVLCGLIQQRFRQVSNVESTQKTRFVMRMSEKLKIELKGKIFRRRSRSYVEERFFLLAKIFNFAAIRNRKGFSEWTQMLNGKKISYKAYLCNRFQRINR